MKLFILRRKKENLHMIEFFSFISYIYIFPTGMNNYKLSIKHKRNFIFVLLHFRTTTNFFYCYPIDLPL